MLTKTRGVRLATRQNIDDCYAVCSYAECSE